MNCRDIEPRLGAYLDGELDAAERAAVEAHLAGCAECPALLERHRALQAAVRAELPAHRASDALRARVREALREAARRPAPRRTVPWRALGVAAAAVLVLAGTWRVATDRARAGFLTDEVLAAHVRSLMPGHLSDVTSTDQHTVKPWFDGRLDFAPSVTDGSARGFPLLGGRLDYLGGRPVAALVYGRRLHRINVFEWPDRGGRGAGGDGGPARAERDGYHLVHWTQGGMVYWAVSDVNRAELEEFVRLLQAAAAPGP